MSVNYKQMISSKWHYFLKNKHKYRIAEFIDYNSDCEYDKYLDISRDYVMSVHTDISNSTEYLILRVYLEKLINKYGVGKIEIENIKNCSKADIIYVAKLIIDKYITSPSERCIHENILIDLNESPLITTNFSLDNYNIVKLDKVNKFILGYLSENITPTYFGNFVETIIGKIYREENLFPVSLNSTILNQNEIVYAYNKITNSPIEYESLIRYNRYEYKSIYHYLAFYSFIKSIDKHSKNYIDFFNSYLKLIDKLDNVNTINDLDEYAKTLYNENIMKKYFKNTEYQFEIRRDNLHGFIDFYNRDMNTIIDIKTSKRILSHNDNDKEVDLSDWFKQLDIYNYCLNETAKTYIIFNPLTNYLYMWNYDENK